MTALSRLLTAVVFLAVPGAASADESLSARIDKYIADGQGEQKKHAAPHARDEEFVRRIYLDLIGAPPTVAELNDFLADSAQDKREKLIDKLLAAPGYARRMAWHFDVMLMERRSDSKVPRAAWEEYLRSVFAENKPYDVLVRELLSSDGADPKTRPAAKFFLDRDFETNLVTRDIGRIFLGRNVQCAQCHDHPQIDDYKQSEYYGIQAFLNRSFLFPNANVPTAVIAEKADGEANFTSVFDKNKKLELDAAACARRYAGGRTETGEGEGVQGRTRSEREARARVQPVGAYAARRRHDER